MFLASVEDADLTYIFQSSVDLVTFRFFLCGSLKSCQRTIKNFVIIRKVCEWKLCVGVGGKENLFIFTGIGKSLSSRDVSVT